MRATILFAAAALGIAFAFAPVQAEDAQKAKCVVSGKEITVTDATKSVVVNGNPVYFCCDNCPKAFMASPEKFVKEAGKCPVNPAHAGKIGVDTRVVINNGLYYVCCPGCPENLANKPATFVKEMKDPVSGKKFKATAESPKMKHEGQTYVFANSETKAAFEKDPAKYAWVYKK